MRVEPNLDIRPDIPVEGFDLLTGWNLVLEYHFAFLLVPADEIVPGNGNRRFDLVPNAQVQGEPGRYLPVVLEVTGKIIGIPSVGLRACCFVDAGRQTEQEI